MDVISAIDKGDPQEGVQVFGAFSRLPGQEPIFRWTVSMTTPVNIMRPTLEVVLGTLFVITMPGVGATGAFIIFVI